MSLIVNSSLRFPRPSKTFGNRLHIPFGVSSCAVVLIRAARFSAVMAGRPNRLVLSPLTKYTCCCDSLPL